MYPFRKHSVKLTEVQKKNWTSAQWRAWMEALPVVLFPSFRSGICECRQNLPRPLPDEIRSYYDLHRQHSLRDHYVHAVEVMVDFPCHSHFQSVFLCETLTRAHKPNELQSLQRRIEYWLKLSQSLYGEQWITVKLHMLLHVLEDVQIVGDLRNTWVFPNERYCGQVKTVKTNGQDDSYFKNKHSHDRNWIKLPEILDYNEYRISLSTDLVPSQKYLEQIQEFVSGKISLIFIHCNSSHST